jgi:methylthioribose-1-phosphate isomerase
VKEFESLALRYKDHRLEILDQRTLPHEEAWRIVEHPIEMARLIKQLSVRGAPLIGVAAACALALYAAAGNNAQKVREAGEILRTARPTAINLHHAVDALLEHADDPKRMVELADGLVVAETQRSEQLAQLGATLIQDGEGIITHCNTGGLATVGVGTALGAVRRAFEQGKAIHVYVDETRPLLQGARLTCWELNKLGIPYTLICDNMAATLMRQGKIQRVLVGADRIAVNGDFANKVGTYGLAVLARHHHIPFHPVAPISTVDFDCEQGSAIPIEERSADEVHGARGFFGDICWTLHHAPVYNPSFDVTPVDLVTSLVLDRGIYTEGELVQGALKEMKSLEAEILCGR